MSALAERLRYDALVSPALLPEPPQFDPMMQTGSSFMGAVLCPDVESAHFDGKMILLKMRSLLNPGSSLIRGSIRLPFSAAAEAIRNCVDQMGGSVRPQSDPQTFDHYGAHRLA